MCIKSAGVPDTQPSQAPLPNLQLVLGNGDVTQSCYFTLDTVGVTPNLSLSYSTQPLRTWTNAAYTLSTRNDTSGAYTNRHLFQNFPSCFPPLFNLTDATSIGLRSMANNTYVSFCLEYFILLPSHVHSSGEMSLHSQTASQTLHVWDSACA